MLAKSMVRERVTHLDFGVRVSQLAPEVLNAFRELALVKRARAQQVDQVGELLSARYQAPRSVPWRETLGEDYFHALQLLSQAEVLFDESPSSWCVFHDSFADVLVRNILRRLRELGLPGAMDTENAQGKLVDYGRLLDQRCSFAMAYPIVAERLRDFHRRRSALPAAHAFSKSTGAPTRFLSAREKRALRTYLVSGYRELALVLHLIRQRRSALRS